MTETRADDLTRAIYVRVADLCHRLPSGIVESICARIDRGLSGRQVDRFAAGLVGIAEPTVRAELVDCATKWLEAHPHGGLESFAIALRGAAASEAASRARQDLELIWTGPRAQRSVLRRTDQALFEVIEAARRELWIVCYSSYKARPVGAALARAHARGVVIKVVVESKEDSDGVLRFSAINALGISDSNVTVIYHWPREKREKDEPGQPALLHAKFAVADSASLFVTSANLTGSALERNMEMGVLIHGTNLPRQTATHLAWLVESGELRELVSG